MIALLLASLTILADLPVQLPDGDAFTAGAKGYGELAYVVCGVLAFGAAGWALNFLLIRVPDHRDQKAARKTQTEAIATIATSAVRTEERMFAMHRRMHGFAEAYENPEEFSTVRSEHHLTRFHRAAKPYLQFERALAEGRNAEALQYLAQAENALDTELPPPQKPPAPAAPDDPTPLPGSVWPVESFHPSRARTAPS